MPKPKARATRVSKPKVVEVEVEKEVEQSTPDPEIKPKPKRVAKVKIVEAPIVEPPPETPKAVRKPRVIKEILPQVPLPVRVSRAEKREQLYHNLASNALP